MASHRGEEKTYLGITDSQGNLTCTDSSITGRTIYFRTSEGSGSAYISTGGSTTVTVKTEGGAIPLVLVAVIGVSTVVVLGAVAWKREASSIGKPKHIKPRPPTKPAGRFCRYCGYQPPTDAVFCPRCGKKL
jgi:hypothetical protein